MNYTGASARVKDYLGSRYPNILAGLALAGLALAGLALAGLALSLLLRVARSLARTRATHTHSPHTCLPTIAYPPPPTYIFLHKFGIT